MFLRKEKPPEMPPPEPPKSPPAFLQAAPAPVVKPEIVIKPLPVLREGIEFRFTGAQRDEDGEPVGQFIDINLVVPPLNFNSLRGLQQKIKSFSESGEDNTASMETLCECLLHALRRNYRGVPRWLIEQSVDVANFAELMMALMDVSGLKRKQVEAEKKAQAEAARIQSTGTQPSPT